jgi:hypothetical protein
MKKTKRILSMALTVLLLVTLLIPALSFAAPKWSKEEKAGGPPPWVMEKLRDKFEWMDGNKIKFNNMNVKFDVPPVIKEGRTLIPVRAIEAMGATVEWFPKDYLVIITKGDGDDKITIKMYLESGLVYVDGVKKEIDIKPGMINNRTYVPLRFIAEALGLKVDYENGKVNVKDQPKIKPTKLTLDKNVDITTDAAVKIILINDYYFDKIKDLTLNTHYTYDEVNGFVYLKETYLEGLKDLDVEITKLQFVFKKDDADDVIKDFEIKLINIDIDKPELDTAKATFYKTTPAAVSVTMDPNDYIFKKVELSDGKSPVYKVNDIEYAAYDLSGDVITFNTAYLSTLTADTMYYFVFKHNNTELKLEFEIEIKN